MDERHGDYLEVQERDEKRLSWSSAGKDGGKGGIKISLVGTNHPDRVNN